MIKKEIKEGLRIHSIVKFDFVPQFLCYPRSIFCNILVCPRQLIPIVKHLSRGYLRKTVCMTNIDKCVGAFKWK